MRQPGLRCNVAKRAVAVVAIKVVPGVNRCGTETRSAKNQDVEPTVVIVIEEGDAAPHRLQDVAGGIHASINNRRS